MKNGLPKNKSPLPYYQIVSFWTIVIFIFLITIGGFSISDITTTISHYLYTPRIDVAGLVQNAKINLFAILSILVFLSSLTIYILKKVTNNNPKTSNGERPLTPDLIAIFFIAVSLQTISHYQSFYNELKIYQGKSTDQKNELLFGKLCAFARDCQKYVPAKETIKFLTDLDIKNDPGMIMGRALGYYLYPIDLRNVRQSKSPAKYFIIMTKEKNTELAPKDRRILHSQVALINDQNYLFLLAGP